jgi:signal transduction histidine kinase
VIVACEPLLGGSFELAAAPGGGTLVRVELPV